MRRQFAIDAKTLALEAVERLTGIVKLSDSWEPEEMKRLHKAIGLTIGKIEMDILGEIYREYKDLDDLDLAGES